LSTRAEIAQAIGRHIQRLGGNVTSLLPPRPGEALVFETRTEVQANEIGAWLRARGFGVTSLGETERLVHNATEEEIVTRMEDGTFLRQIVSHPGHARVHRFEVVLPSDASMREIPGKPPPRPVKGPPQRRRRG
jgi:hypothetical protein